MAGFGAVAAPAHAGQSAPAGPVAPNTPVATDAVKTDLLPAGPAVPTHLVLANLSEGVDLTAVMTAHHLGVGVNQSLSVTGLEVRILPAPTATGWAACPDASRQGEIMALVSRPEEGQIKFYSKMTHWATLETRTARFIRNGSAPWKHAAISFHKGDSAFQIILVDATAATTAPFPALELTRKRWLTSTAQGEFRLAVNRELWSRLQFSTGNGQPTRWRLEAPALRGLADEIPNARQEIMESLPVITVAEHGENQGELIFDRATLIATIGERMSKARVAPASTGPVANANSPFTGVKELDSMGAWLLERDCPGNLKSYSGYLRSAVQPASWESYVDYLDKIAQTLGALYALDEAPAVNPDSPRRLGTSSSSTKSAKIYQDEAKNYQRRAGQQYAGLRDQLRATKTAPESIWLCSSRITTIGANLSQAAFYTDRPPLYSTTPALQSAQGRSLSNAATQVQAIAVRWQQRFQDESVRKVISEQRRLAGAVVAPAPADDAEARRRQIAEVTRRIPNNAAALGRLTLEMDVASGVWWPIIVFTETAP